MGKKLTSWEKRERKEEKEREAALSREKTATRRQKEREEKEKLLKSKIQDSQSIINNYDKFYFDINNLHLISYNLVKGKDIKKIVKNSLPLGLIPAFPGLNVQPIVFLFDKRNFLDDPKLKDLKSNSKLSINQYAKAYKLTYISFLDFLFGVKNKYQSFKGRTLSEIKKIEAQDVERKTEFEEVLNDYKKVVEDSNAKKINLIETEYDKLQEQYNDKIEEIHFRNEELKIELNSISKDFMELRSPIVHEILFKLLPIDFNLGHENYLKSNPSKYPIGIGKIDKQTINFYIEIPDDYFPVEDKAIVMLKDGHKEKNLTKAQINEIKGNYVPSLILSYSYLLFSLSKAEEINVFVISKMVDPSTGHKKLAGVDSRLIEKTILDQLNFTKIQAGKAIGNFKKINLDEYINDDKIYWSNNRKPKEFDSKEYLNDISLYSIPVESNKKGKAITKKIELNKTAEIIEFENKLIDLSGKKLKKIQNRKIKDQIIKKTSSVNNIKNRMGLSNWIESVFKGINDNNTRKFLDRASKSEVEPEIIQKLRAIEEETKELNAIIKKYSK